MLGLAPVSGAPLAAPLWLFDTQTNVTGLTFTCLATPALRHASTAITTLTFSGRVEARAAGRPLRFSAIPQSFDFRAERALFEFTAVPDSFTFRGVPE